MTSDCLSEGEKVLLFHSFEPNLTDITSKTLHTLAICRMLGKPCVFRSYEEDERAAAPRRVTEETDLSRRRCLGLRRWLPLQSRGSPGACWLRVSSVWQPSGQAGRGKGDGVCAAAAAAAAAALSHYEDPSRLIVPVTDAIASCVVPAGRRQPLILSVLPLIDMRDAPSPGARPRHRRRFAGSVFVRG